MLSYTCETAVKAVIFLATKSAQQEKTGIKEIAEYIDASEHTLGKLLQNLVREGVINSIKGPGGGFYVSKQQMRQSLINIVEAIDGKNIFRECGLGLSQCDASHPCPIHNQYKEARDIIEKIFRTKTVEDLIEPVNKGKAYLFG